MADDLNEITQQLEQHASGEFFEENNISDLFARDPLRFEQYSLQAAGLLLDYSKQLITDDTLSLLCNLAETADLRQSIKDLFSGAIVNRSENQPALHTALRDPSDNPVQSVDDDIKQQIQDALTEMEKISNAVRSGEWLGELGQAVSDVICIGIGGSELGPRLAVEALRHYYDTDINFHFASNVDGYSLMRTLDRCQGPHTTLCVISSKTFSTVETLSNAKIIFDWYKSELSDFKRHVIAVTANPEKAKEFGIEHVLPFWSWVGGRYSMWSAVGLPIAIAIGMSGFRDLLAGAHEMDQHFRHAPFKQNMPVLMGLLGIWNINYLAYDALAILPYCDRLQRFPDYLQQLDMESNGKSVTATGEWVDYATAPIVWGGVGTNCQHSFMQKMHQGFTACPVDFIAVKEPNHGYKDLHQLQLASCFSQSKALMEGRSPVELKEEMLASGMEEQQAEFLANSRACLGNCPSNTVILDQLTPESLGALIACYEHKVYVQSCLWRINAFDQWGVELGKKLSKDIYSALQTADKEFSSDSSTLGLIRYVK